jgi:opacity protein-like surface antigen
MLKHPVTALTIAIFPMSLTAFAQEDYTRFKNESSVQALGSFVTQTTQNGVQHGATDSSGVLATYRHYFDRHNGVEVNYAWISNAENYNGFGLSNNSHEISAAYVFRMPMKRWSTFVLAGAGALIFDPSNLAGANMQTRAALVYGGGADFNLTNHLFVRAEYRD